MYKEINARFILRSVSIPVYAAKSNETHFHPGILSSFLPWQRLDDIVSFIEHRDASGNRGRPDELESWKVPRIAACWRGREITMAAFTFIRWLQRYSDMRTLLWLSDLWKNRLNVETNLNDRACSNMNNERRCLKLLSWFYARYSI